MGLLAALAGLIIVNAAIGWYFLTINKEKVPGPVGPFAAVVAYGLALSVAGLVLQFGIATVLMAAWNLMIGGLILYLLSIRKLPDGELIVSVGDAMPPLTALDANGAPFDLASLRGKRVLFKFFRGHW